MQRRRPSEGPDTYLPAPARTLSSRHKTNSLQAAIPGLLREGVVPFSRPYPHTCQRDFGVGYKAGKSDTPLPRGVAFASRCCGFVDLPHVAP